jgi:succinyl-CoA synthetase beta subunit
MQDGGAGHMSMRSSLDEAAALIAAARAQHRSTMSEPDAKAFLGSLGIPVPPARLIRDVAAAAAALSAVGPPVVVKAVARGLTHKTEAGGVIMPIETPAAAEAACRTIAQRVGDYRPGVVLEGFLIEAYRPGQPEWILALRVDPDFGPTIMFGLGGIYVEALRQVAFRLAPLREHDIDALLTERPAMRILKGARGKPAPDRNALRDAIRRLSDVARRPDIVAQLSEIEINPLIISDNGVLALDALVVLRS